MAYCQWVYHAYPSIAVIMLRSFDKPVRITRKLDRPAKPQKLNLPSLVCKSPLAPLTRIRGGPHFPVSNETLAAGPARGVCPGRSGVHGGPGRGDEREITRLIAAADSLIHLAGWDRVGVRDAGRCWFDRIWLICSFSTPTNQYKHPVKTRQAHLRLTPCASVL